jgi:hypothetical protein
MGTLNAVGGYGGCALEKNKSRSQVVTGCQGEGDTPRKILIVVMNGSRKDEVGNPTECKFGMCPKTEGAL